MTVFANGLEVSAKEQGCKVIAAFPDTCFTPPQTPATPPGVPIPYPNFATDGDLASGSGTVTIKGGEISQENSSKFSKVTGDEAGSAPKKGIMTSNKGGPAYAKKWSMDVKVEGKGVVRFGDLATSNHSSDPSDAPPTYVQGKAKSGGVKCGGLLIAPFDQLTCPPGHWREHTVEVQFFTAVGCRTLVLKCCESYDPKKAPCICMKSKWLPSEEGKKYPDIDPDYHWEVGDACDRRGTPHSQKGVRASQWLDDNPQGSADAFTDKCAEYSVKAALPEADRAEALKCLKFENKKYLRKAMNKDSKELKELKKCHGTCKRAKADAARVAEAKRLIGKPKVSVSQVDRLVPKSTVSC